MPSTEPDIPGISCIIPVHNEEEAIGPTLIEVKRALEASGFPHEIIVVNDGSSDATAKAMADSTVGATLLTHATNRGYGAAIKTGLRTARHEWILILDADSTYPPAELPKLIASMRMNPVAEMIVGQREQSLQTDGAFRLAGKAVLRRVADFLSGQKIPDLNSGFRLFRRKRAEQFWPLLPDGFSLTTSITLALLCSGVGVAYAPIEYRRRTGRSKIRPLRDMVGFLGLILRTITYFNPLKVYLPLAFVLVAAAFTTVVLSKVIGHRVMDVTALFLFIAGLQMLLIGVLADLILKSIGMRK